MEALQLSHRLHKLGLRRNYSLLRLLDQTLLGCGPTDWYSSRPFSFCSRFSYSKDNCARQMCFGSARSMRRRSQLSAACHRLSVDLSFISLSSRHSRYAVSSCICCSCSLIFGFRHNSSLELVCSWSLRPASIDPTLLASRLLLAPVNSFPI
jgi:hypothetical protein